MDVPMALIHCAECNMPFTITTDLRDKLKKSHKSFFCPIGHSQFFPAKSDEEKLREQIQEQSAKIIRLQSEKMKLEKQVKKPARKKKAKVTS